MLGFYQNGYEGSADYILKADGTGQRKFLEMIIRKEWPGTGVNKNYAMMGNAINGFGIYATRDILCNELIFKEKNAHSESRPVHILKKLVC